MNIVKRPDFSVTKVRKTGQIITRDFNDWVEAEKHYIDCKENSEYRWVYLFNHHTMLVDLDSNMEAKNVSRNTSQ